MPQATVNLAVIGIPIRQVEIVKKIFKSLNQGLNLGVKDVIEIDDALAIDEKNIEVENKFKSDMAKVLSFGGAIKTDIQIDDDIKKYKFEDKKYLSKRYGIG
ncbi:hypothetical protein [uncultured Campylobacter sp.]|jgi:hypothetical protein|uniref:hypothetical protein n=1 Tax=uncultured Campylobacter sp. TaxID=218934 RepID=UPI0015B113E8|nr:hypothetical protein [uncultured Campylobacter sp.]